MDDSNSSSLSDLFGENSSDDYVLPSEEESSDEISFLPRKKKKQWRNLGLRKNLSTTTAAEKLPHQNAADQHNNMVHKDIAHQNTPKKKTRKIKSRPDSWMSNVRKKAHQEGKSYINRRGKTVPEREVKSFKNCDVACKFKCQQHISPDERLDLHISYYSLPSATEKRHFLLSNTKRSLTARPARKLSNVPHAENPLSSEDEEIQVPINKQSRRQFSFKYSFTVKGDCIQVCKPFFLGTLSISQKPVYTAHRTKIVSTNTATQDKRGTSENSRRKPQGDPDFARKHIESFPTVEAHYCRANTTRNYLGSHLSVPKMHSLYLEQCAEKNHAPVKMSLYWKIFNTEYNLGFHIPKSDRCDVCEKFNVAKKNQTLTHDIEEEYGLHVVHKNLMREVRSKEKANNIPVLLFDLQNVILTPHADIGSLFYLSKLKIYNLTAYYTPTKKVYCALWTEIMAGRSGNDIASAFKKILDVVADENEITDLVTWSDSCVPQNRNSFISNAVLDFLRDNTNISSVTMKYSLAGHSCVQEVDNAHSQIEKAFKKNDFFSPIGLIRLLKRVNTNNPFKIIQMKAEEFKDYGSVAKLLNYREVPYSQVATIKFTRSFSIICFKTSHDPYEPENCKSIRISESPKRKCRSERSSMVQQNVRGNALSVKPKMLKRTTEISEARKKDIVAAFPYMPVQDKDYYKHVLKLNTPK